MFMKPSFVDLWHSLHHVVTHAVITIVAVGLAFALPQGASYILFNWWPLVREDAQMLLLTEVGFAAVLVLLMNLLKLTWDYRKRARLASLASLVYAREQPSGGGPGKRPLPPLWKRDLGILAVTGYGTFAAEDSPFRETVEHCYEIRVMLMNPYGQGAEAYAGAHADAATTLANLRREVEASIDALRRLQAGGKKVALKLYDEPPFWKLVFTGEYAWVRCCHTSRDAGKFPEYVFALQPESPQRGFFPAFYTYFLDRWNDPVHPDYAFESDELVYRDAQGAELRRRPYPEARPEPAAAAQPQPATRIPVLHFVRPVL